MPRWPRGEGIRRLPRLSVSPMSTRAAVDDEIRFHIDSRISDLTRSGVGVADARKMAEQEYGDTIASRAELLALDTRMNARDRRTTWRDALTFDVRYAARAIRRSPAFSVLVVLTMALGIGANATMFGIVDRLLFQPPTGVRNADLVGRIYFTFTLSGKSESQESAGFEHYLGMRDQTHTLEQVAAYHTGTATYGRGVDAREITQSGVTPEFFRTLGVRTRLGRFFGESEDRAPKGSDVAVISDGFWKNEFGAATSAIGRRITIGSRTYTIIGVVEPGFSGVDLNRRVEVWIPLSADGFEGLGQEWSTPGMGTWLHVLGRRKEAVSISAVNADLTHADKQVSLSVAEHYGGKSGDPHAAAIFGPLLSSRGFDLGGGAGLGRVNRDSVRRGRIATWLFAMSLFVLIIASANVISLHLARGIRREHEIAVRLALGISRVRLIRQLATEGAMLTVAGGVAGVLLAATGGALLRRLLVPDVMWDGVRSVDVRMLFFCSLATVAVGLLTALSPAVSISRHSAAATLRLGSQAYGGRRSRLRDTLFVLQTTLAVMLLIGAGLFVRSLHNVLSIPLGLDAAHVLLVEYDVSAGGYTRAQTAALYVAAREQATHVPGVRRASVALTAPFWSSLSSRVLVPGIDSVPRAKDGGPYVNGISPGFFATIGTRLVAGRDFNESDRADGGRVAILGATMARALWPAGGVIGQCIKVRSDTVPCSIVVGIVEDAKRYNLEDASFQYYVPIDQRQVPAALRVLLVQTAGAPEPLVAPLRRELASIAPMAAFVSIRSLEGLIDPQRQAWRLGATMFAVFGALALGIAAIGLYAIIALDVSRRRREFGVRMALGATRHNVGGLVMANALRLTLPGLILGLAGMLLVASSLEPLLYHASARDPLVAIVVVATLLFAASCAALGPSYRATRVDPVKSLRGD